MLDVVSFDRPELQDAEAMERIVRRSGVLDPNSRYAYLLLCDRFADTCVVARQRGRVVGFVTAMLAGDRPSIVVVWQVGVSLNARGRGLARRMLQTLLRRPTCRRITHLETTIRRSNEASDALFRAFAREEGAHVDVRDGYPGSLFSGPREGEQLYRIGPFVHRNRVIA